MNIQEKINKFEDEINKTLEKINLIDIELKDLDDTFYTDEDNNVFCDPNAYYKLREKEWLINLLGRKTYDIYRLKKQLKNKL